MGTETYQTDNITVRIKPYQKEITLDMAFHVSYIVAGPRVRTVLFRNRFLLTQQFKNIKQLLQFFRIVAESLVVFLIL